MSVVISYMSSYGLVFGSDCAVTFADSTQVPGMPKVWSEGDMMYGLVGDGKVFTKLRYDVVWPSTLDSSTALEYAVNHVMPRIEMVLEEDDSLKEENWELLIGHPMGVVACDGAGLFLPRTQVMAIGSGGKYAMATAEVLHEMSTVDPRLCECLEDAEMLVEHALLRTIERDAYCGMPTVVLSLQGEQA